MSVLVSGICGFVGSALGRALALAGHEVVGFDSFIRPGSETNRLPLRDAGVAVRHADLRNASDIDALPAADWVIDAAANPSVLAGVDGTTSSRQLVEHNLLGTLNLLEYCKRHGAGFILLSTSRVYSVRPLSRLDVEVVGGAFRPRAGVGHPPGLSGAGVAEGFSTDPPVSLYGATKLASEALALEYAEAFGLPVWINRCGVLAGGGQFGRPDQGILGYWIHAWAGGRPLRYIGFDGRGHQVRDALHPSDLLPVLAAQFREPTDTRKPRIANFAGGADHAISLRQLSAWCERRFGPREVLRQPEPRPYDIPWMVLDSGLAGRVWDWAPSTSLDAILDEIAEHAEAHPDWLDISQ